MAGPDQSEKLVQELDWNLLRTYMMIVQEGSLTAAAERLGIQQPAISLALKRLETRLGGRFIERSSNVFKVTPAGELLYQECVRIYGSVFRLTSGLRGVRDAVAGHIRIALASNVESPVFNDTLAEFHKQYPQVTYSINVAKSRDITKALLDQQESFGIILVNRQNPMLDYLHVCREYFGFFCGPRHRYFGRRDLELADLKGERAVSFSADILSDVLRPLALFREQVGFDPLVVGTSAHLEEVRRMIIAGLGIGPLPIHLAERDVQDDLLWQLPPYKSDLQMDLYLAWNPEARFNRAETLMLEALQDAVDALPLEKRTFARSLSAS